jgi:pyrroline-5-carboxylate reductase
MSTSSVRIAFVGGGNMASAIIGGLISQGASADTIQVIEPDASQRERLRAQWGLDAWAQAQPELAQAQWVVWAVKPQLFAQAAQPCAPFVGQSCHLSVMAGIRTATLVQAVGSARVVRAMPNTPALIGQGISGLFARTEVSAQQREQVQALLAPTGQTLWVDAEDDLDAVTALSGSGPAYVFYFIEAMMEAGMQMGLNAQQSRALALGTFAGATALAQASDEPPSVLRERVTSKGGTTFAALESMKADGVAPALVRAVRAAQQRAAELGALFAAPAGGSAG